MNRLGTWVILGGLAAAAWALGCGEDDPGNPPRQTTIEVRNGTWAIAETSSFSGHDSCLARGTEIVDTTDVVCSKSLLEADPDFPIQCTITQDGDSVVFDCQLRVDLGICNQYVFVTGGGAVTDTTFDLVLDVSQVVRPKHPEDEETCELFYGRLVDDCTLTVHSVGTWMDSTGSFKCPDDTLSAAPRLALLPTAIRRVLASR